MFFADVNCGGTEQKLLDCPKTPFIGSYCTHLRDVGVKCQRKWISSISSDSILLLYSL